MSHESASLAPRHHRAVGRPHSPLQFPRSFARVVGLLAAALSAWSGSASAQYIEPDLFATNGTVYAMARSGNMLYIGGDFEWVGRTPGAGVPVDGASGALPESFPSVLGMVWTVTPDGAGGWYIGGDFTVVGGVPRQSLAHVAADLTVSPWNPGAQGNVSAVRSLLLDGSTLYVGGSFVSIGGQPRSRIAAVNATTGAVTGWNPGADGWVLALAKSGSTVYAGGFFAAIGGQPRVHFAALDASTGAAMPWAADANGDVYALATIGSTVYVGGHFTAFGGQARNYLAAIDGSTGNVTGWNPNGGPGVRALAVSGSTVYAGGEFTQVGGVSRSHLAAIDATTGAVTGWNPGAGYPVLALAVGGGTVYPVENDLTSLSRLSAVDASTGSRAWIAEPRGNLQAVGASGASAYMGGEGILFDAQARSNIAALDLSTGEVTAWNPSAQGSLPSFAVHALAVEGSTVYAGGRFTTIGGQPRNRIAALDAVTGAATAWNPGASAKVNAILVNGPTVYAGGEFTNIGGQTRNFLAALDAATGTATTWNASCSGIVTSLEAVGSTMYVGGSFLSLRGQTRLRLGAIDLTTGSLVAFNPSPGPNAPVYALKVSGATVYAGGSFEFVGAQPRNYIAAFDATSGALAAWNPNASGVVRALAADATTVYAGGDFTGIGGQARSRIAALDAATGLANTTWNPGVSMGPFSGLPSVHALTMGVSRVYAGGDFDLVGSATQNNVAGIAVVPPSNVAVPPGGVSVSGLGVALHPNPSPREFRVTFSLPGSAPARLELLDVSGRMVAAREVGAFGAGTHVVALGDGRALPPGAYLVRLKQGARVTTARGVILQ